jgi:uncharacterized protein (TIGR03382 family)
MTSSFHNLIKGNIMKNTLMLTAILMSFSVGAAPKQMQTLTLNHVDMLAQSVDSLTNGKAITNLRGTRGSAEWYSIDIPDGASDLTITTQDGSGDVDLYAGFGEDIITDGYECVSWEEGNDEICEFSSPSAGKYYVALYGYEAYSGVELKATFTDPPKTGCSSTTGNGTLVAFALLILAGMLMRIPSRRGFRSFP